MERREKLIELINYYADGSQAEFCRKTGLEKTSLSRMVSGKMAVTDRQVAKIRAALPDAGPFLDVKTDLPRPKSVTERLADMAAEIDALKKEVAIKNRVIEALLDKCGR